MKLTIKTLKPITLAPFSTLTLAQWRSSDERVNYVIALLQTPLFRELMGVLQNEMPRVYPRDGTTQIDSQAAYAMVPGYQRCLETIMAASKHIELNSEMPNEIYANTDMPVE